MRELSSLVPRSPSDKDMKIFSNLLHDNTITSNNSDPPLHLNESMQQNPKWSLSKLFWWLISKKLPFRGLERARLSWPHSFKNTQEKGSWRSDSYSMQDWMKVIPKFPDGDIKKKTPNYRIYSWRLSYHPSSLNCNIIWDFCDFVPIDSIIFWHDKSFPFQNTALASVRRILVSACLKIQSQFIHFTPNVLPCTAISKKSKDHQANIYFCIRLNASTMP